MKISISFAQFKVIVFATSAFGAFPGLYNIGPKGVERVLLTGILSPSYFEFVDSVSEADFIAFAATIPSPAGWKVEHIG
jgi:hypothetical protein